MEIYGPILFSSRLLQCHSGVLGGGHYISYSKGTSGKWYCLNDSACKVILQYLSQYFPKT